MWLTLYFIVSVAIATGLAIGAVNKNTDQTEKFVLLAVFTVVWPGVLFILLGLLMAAGFVWTDKYLK